MRLVLVTYLLPEAYELFAAPVLGGHGQNWKVEVPLAQYHLSLGF